MSQELKIAWGVVGSLLTGLLEARKYEDFEAYQTRLAEFEEANRNLQKLMLLQDIDKIFGDRNLFLTQPHPMLGGQTPEQAMASGDWEVVWQIVSLAGLTDASDTKIT